MSPDQAARNDDQPERPRDDGHATQDSVADATARDSTEAEEQHEEDEEEVVLAVPTAATEFENDPEDEDVTGPVAHSPSRAEDEDVTGPSRSSALNVLGGEAHAPTRAQGLDDAGISGEVEPDHAHAAPAEPRSGEDGKEEVRPLDGADPGDPDSGTRARDLISRELLDELSHEPDDWNEGRSAPTPPLAGFETPSDTRTPSPRGSPRPSYHYQNQDAQVHNEGLMCIDQWDWKTDAPEFVPGCLAGLATAAAQPLPEEQVVSSPVYGQSGHNTWAMAQSPAAGNSPCPGDGCGGDATSSMGDSLRLGQLRAQYEWQLQSKSEELQDLQSRMSQLEMETAQVRASWDIERQNLMRQITHYRVVLERYCIPLEEAGSNEAPQIGCGNGQQGQYFAAHEAAPGQWGNAGGGGNAASGCAGNAPTAAPPSPPRGQTPASWSGCCGGGGGAGTGFGGAMPSSAEGFLDGASQPSNWARGGRSGNGVEGAGGNGSGNGASAGAAGPSSLDSKMRQLNSLLQEGQAASRKKGGATTNEGQAASRKKGGATTNGKSGEADPHEGGSGQEGGVGYSSGAIASTLRAMFPHATIRTKAMQGEEGDVAEGAEAQPSSETSLTTGQEARGIEQCVRQLERSTNCTVDDRAMRSLQALSTKDAKEALQKVNELVDTQGGTCRNLSSILQSVCRKIEKRNGRSTRGEDEQAPRSGGSAPTPGVERRGERERPERGADRGDREKDQRGERERPERGADRDDREKDQRGAAAAADAQRSRRARRQDEDGDAFDLNSASSDENGFKEPLERTFSHLSQVTVETNASKRSSKSWADMHSGDEDEEEHWNTQRVERAARRGFDVRRRGGKSEQWDLKISMAALDPPLTEAGMSRYCKWLKGRLQTFREEHGVEPLRRCRGEIDFSYNHMNNEMVWMLLESLSLCEVHTALLKLFANQISQGGVLAICEFMRLNSRAEALQELHLSHNEIDDDSALELLRTLHQQRPRYPPRRYNEVSGDFTVAPVWLRLNHNRIRDPEKVRRMAEAEGITICTAWDRNACGTSKCYRATCPLVHLYSFNMQPARRRQSSPRSTKDEDANGDGGVNGEGRGARRRRGRKGCQHGDEGKSEEGKSAGGGAHGSGHGAHREQRDKDAPPREKRRDRDDAPGEPKDAPLREKRRDRDDAPGEPKESPEPARENHRGAECDRRGLEQRRDADEDHGSDRGGEPPHREASPSPQPGPSMAQAREVSADVPEAQS